MANFMADNKAQFIVVHLVHQPGIHAHGAIGHWHSFHWSCKNLVVQGHIR